MKRVKVLQLISSGGYYGAENMLLNLCASQQKAGCQNSLLIFYNVHAPNVEFYERARRRGLSVRMVHCQGRADWRAVRQIEEYIQEDEIDLLHTHGYKADLYGYVAARRSHKPIVATCHNWVGGTAALGIYNHLDRLALKRFNALAAVSDSVVQRLIDSGVSPRKIKNIANGIDVEPFERARTLPALAFDGRKVVGMVARLDLQKGFEYLLRAVRELCVAFRELKVVIVGEGSDRKAIEDMIQQYGLQSNVVLAGQQSDMPGVYAAMDIFVLPSLNEGLPMTILEAMAASKPVIATRVGAIPSLIKDGDTGLLIGPRDADGLRDAIASLLSDSELCGRLGAAGHDWVSRHYTSEVMALKYCQMYEEVLGLPSIVTVPARALDNASVDARRA
ncbi:MAG TPA: glycosyltransferase family 4 protein [Candidatus Polarisedimenticolia bacterium]|jgi:glycosyltransferase involved in cell wall biosynthesis|nr:glycosyltransferase family 4 protein [Candidatus Polarisedimenticolia bacterium]